MAFGRRVRSSGSEKRSLDVSPEEKPTETFVDQGCVLAGELRFGGDVRIDGRVEGQIQAEKAVVIGKLGEIDATIEAETLEVYGTVVGDIRVRGNTTLHKTARVEGEIQTEAIVVEKGARVRGCIVIGSDADPISLSDPVTVETGRDLEPPLLQVGIAKAGQA